MLHAKENSYYPLSIFCITNKLPTTICIRRLDSSNKVDSVDCKVVKCPSLRVWDRYNTFLMFIWSKLGKNPLRMEVRTFARMKKVIWDQLLDTKAEIIQRKMYFRFACIMPELSLERLTRGHNKGFWLHSLQSVNEHHNCVIQSNIPFESKALIKPDENIFYTQ